MVTGPRFTLEPVFVSTQRKQKTGEFYLNENGKYIGLLSDKRFADLVCGALNHVFETAELTREGDLMPDGDEFEIPNDVAYEEHCGMIDDCRNLVEAYVPPQGGLDLETEKTA